jgi:hypothetical protein
MATQRQRLLTYLEKHDKINPIEAWRKLGIYRLGARIFDLRAEGWYITKDMVDVQNRFGETCKVAEYRLGSGQLELAL